MTAAFRTTRMAPLRYHRLAAGVGLFSMPPYRPAIPLITSFSMKKQASRPMHPPAPRSQPRRSVLEVERKFAPTATSIRQLDQNTGEPPFDSVVHKGVSCFEDTYYDTPTDTLSKAGVWIRRREKLECGVRPFSGHRRRDPPDVSWEAKVRVGGDFINSALREVTDVREISGMLGTFVPGAELGARHGPRGGRVREMARLVTDGTGYVVDGRFSVVIDVADFGHTVGEVELEKDAAEASLEGEDRARAIAAMDEEIDGFMRSFGWAFPAGKPVGKLTAYFERKDHRLLDEQD